MAFGGPVTFDAACAWVDGYTSAVGSGALAGFREWVCVLNGGGYQCSWRGAVHAHFLGIDPAAAAAHVLTEDEDRDLGMHVFDMLDRFFARVEAGERGQMFAEYTDHRLASGVGML